MLAWGRDHFHELQCGDRRCLDPQPLVNRGFGRESGLVEPFDFREIGVRRGKQKHDFVQRRHGQDGEGGAEQCGIQAEFCDAISRATCSDAIALKG